MAEKYGGKKVGSWGYCGRVIWRNNKKLLVNFVCVFLSIKNTHFCLEKRFAQSHCLKRKGSMGKVLPWLLLAALFACGKKKHSVEATWTQNPDGSSTGTVGKNPDEIIIDGRAIQCGGPNKSCYDDSIAIGAREATTPSGKKIVFGKNGLGVELWTEKDGNKILQANGLDQWQMRLNPNGKSYSDISFESKNLIAGRACPPNVYMNDNDKFSPNHCLYYDAGESEVVTLDAAGTSQQTLGSIGLGAWNAIDASPRWYVGNVETCAKEGMRLPTAFETALPTPADFSTTIFPTADGVPTFGDGKGVPNLNDQGYFNWTATADRGHTSSYAVWRKVEFASQSYSYTHKIRCVIP